DDVSGSTSVRWSRIVVYVVLAVALAFCFSVAPMSAAGQPSGRIQRVGYLAGSSQPPGPQRVREALPRGLQELGWVEGKNLVFEFRDAEGRYDRLPDLAAELVQLKVDVIVAVGNAATAAAKNTTRTIPIVMISVGDPVGSGLVRSLAHPGGNVTGLTYSVGMDT